MTMLTSLARAQAAVGGVAQPIATVRHVHLHDRPLVIVILTMAGEANAPLAAMVGTDPERPHVMVVPQPRNRDLRFGFAAALAEVMLVYIESSCDDAPQVLVPNPGGIGFLRLLGRSTRFRRTDGEYAVAPTVPVLGRWLTFLAERTEHPGSSLLLAATDVLTLHWAAGQSPVEDLNLAALVGWVDPPPGLTGAQAAAEAEDPIRWPPAGPASDPTFDNEVLAVLVGAYDRAPTESAQRRATHALETALTTQLEPTWRLMWRVGGLLRALPAGERVAERWAADRNAFSAYAEYLRGGGLPQPRRDSAVAAAWRLHFLERAQATYDAQRAFDDPLVMAEHRLSGEAFAGIVVAADPARTIVGSSGRARLRPLVTVETADPIRLEPGTTVTSPARPSQKATIVDIDQELVRLELCSGMGRSLTPTPGSVPQVGERLCYTTLTEAYQPAGAFPAREDTPWTHGGPPVEYVPTDDDAHEEWS